MLTPIHDPKTGVMRTVAFMSGSGTNLRRILEHRERLLREEGSCPFEVSVIFTDNGDSRATAIGREYDLPVIVHDIRGFYRRRGLPRTDLSVRADFDALTLKALSPFQTPVLIYAGYMSIVTENVIRSFTGVNVHPGDLSVMQSGRRRWTGAHAVRDAVLAGEKTIRATTHLVTLEVDSGPLLMLSDPLAVETPDDTDWKDDPAAVRRVEEHNQERLKEAGDWTIFPRTIEDLARGLFARDERDRMYYNHRLCPIGSNERTD